MEVVGVPGGWDGTSDKLCLWPDDFSPWFTKEGRKVPINNAHLVIARVFLEVTSRGEGNQQFLGDPDAVNGWFPMMGALLEGSQHRMVGVCQGDCFPERVGGTEGHEIRVTDVLIISAMKMMQSPASCQGARMTERLQKKARQGQVELPRNSKWCHC